MTDRARGLLLASVATALLSTDASLVRAADTDAFDIMFWTGLLSALAAFGYATATERVGPVALVRRTGRIGLIGGLLQGATVVAFVIAVSNTSVANASVIIAAAPLSTGLLSWLVLRERTSRQVWIAIAVTMGAIVFVISGSLGGGGLGGDLAAVVAIATYSCLTVLLRRHGDADRSVVVALGGLVMAAVAVGPATLLGHGAGTWLAMLTMGLVVGPVSRAGIATAVRYLPATEVALFAPVETVLATLWAYLAFDEAPSTRTWIGGVVIVVAVLWATWPRRPTSVTSPADAGARRRPSSGVTAR